MVLPGVVGGLCLLLAVMGFSFLPVTATGVLLIVAAIGLFIAEAVVQSFGLLGMAGVVALALGGIMLVDLPEEGINVDPWLAISTAIGFGLIAIFLATLAIRAMRRKATTGAEGLVGADGVAVTALELRGKVRIGGEYWDAVALCPVPQNASIRVVSLTGLLLTVEPAGEKVDSP